MLLVLSSTLAATSCLHLCSPLMLVYGVTVVVGRRGTSTVLQCEDHRENRITAISWKFHHMNSYLCLFSYAVIYNEGPKIFTNCSTRISLSNTSLTIQDTQISDGGNHTCEISNPMGTVIRTINLQILAQPFVSLDVGSSGFPECKAIGGFPAAEISWIPHSDTIHTTKIKKSNDTWTVISTFHQWNGVTVTCFVSHPTFSNPWNSSIQTEKEVGKCI
uniref:Ig-like domain-containing protein n=1 Tax=Pyxicephalus adspersus TaxID=30357 RepID=A0AAV3ASW7_PYXAD|nr:TPA: hypothetical protein GDO54_002109 [Pyxicephalus adspersus]